MKNILKYLSAQLFRGFGKFVYHSFKKKNLKKILILWKMGDLSKNVQIAYNLTEKIAFSLPFFDISSNIRILSYFSTGIGVFGDPQFEKEN